MEDGIDQLPCQTERHCDKAFAMLQDDRKIMDDSRIEVDAYLLYLGVRSANDLLSLEEHFIDELKNKMRPAHRNPFKCLFEVS